MSNERDMLSPQERDQQQLILKYAAKAYGITLDFSVHGDFPPYYINERGGHSSWNPLTDSADCAAMCAKLEIDTMWFRDQVECEAHPVQDNSFGSIYSQFNNDREAAWRYAAVQVAAMIGGMK